MIYLVAADLPPRPRDLLEMLANKDDRQLFFAELMNCRAWWNYVSGIWLVSTPETIETLEARLFRHIIPATDKLLILQMPINLAYKGWLPKEAWDWIQQEIAAGHHYDQTYS